MSALRELRGFLAQLGAVVAAGAVGVFIACIVFMLYLRS